MTARPYIARKYVYTDDFGRDTLKIQREFLDPDTLEPILEVTSQFQFRELQSPEKAEVNFNGEKQRRLVTYVDTSDGTATLQQFIPFKDVDNKKVQIRQILAKTSVICGDFRGENSGNQRVLNQWRQ